MAGGSGGRRDGIGHQFVSEGGADGVVVLQGDDAGHPPVAGALEGVEAVPVVREVGGDEHLGGDVGGRVRCGPASRMSVEVLPPKSEPLATE